MRKVALVLLVVSVGYVPMVALAQPAKKHAAPQAREAMYSENAYKAAVRYQKRRCGQNGWLCENAMYVPIAVYGPYGARRYQWAAYGFVEDTGIVNSQIVSRVCEIVSTWTQLGKRYSASKKCDQPQPVPPSEN